MQAHSWPVGVVDRRIEGTLRGDSMSRKTYPQNGDGLDAANDQPAKTLTKSTTDVIALCAMLVLTDPRLFTLAWAVGLVGLLAGMGVFQ